MRFDLRLGFPAVTTKKLAFKSAIGELVGFLRGSRNAAEFRALGSKVWDANANDNVGWLANPFREGRAASARYRCPVARLARLQAAAAGQTGPDRRRPRLRLHRNRPLRRRAGRPSVLLYKAVDQLRRCLDTIIERPGDRRILFHGWNWAQLDEMALPPCHLLYQFLPNPTTREISLALSTSAATTSAWALRSISPKAPPCCTWSAA